MFTEETFEQALDLMKAYAAAVSEDKQMQSMAQLLTLEQAMTLVEQCDYAMRLCAEVNQTTIDVIEQTHNINAIVLENSDPDDLEGFINAHRGNLIAGFHATAIANAAAVTLRSLIKANAPQHTRKAIAATLLANTPKPPNMLNN